MLIIYNVYEKKLNSDYVDLLILPCGGEREARICRGKPKIKVMKMDKGTMYPKK
jgi:hypothetical protein